MVTEKSTKPSKENIEALKSEVASFASSLGLASSASSYSGFNDTDFRNPKPKSKPKPKQKDHKPPPPPFQKPQLDKKTSSKPPPFRIKNDKSQKPISKPTPKPPVLSLDAGDDQNSNITRKFDKYKNLPKLPLVKAGAVGVWHVDLMELENKVLGEESKGKLEVKMGVGEWKSFVEKKRELGERLLWQYGKDYEQGRGQKGDIKMLVATQRSGTNADKVSAFSVLIGDNPVGNLRSLDALLGMVTSKVGKRHALTGFEALKELFISTLLPDRKLKTLLQRPLNNVPETKDGYSLLLFWYWEDCLKQRYERFVFALEEASRDMLPALKDKSLKIIYALLKSKSEQERRLLSALVNKLGDPQNKSASNADYHLSNLLSDHPNMKAVVIDEVDSFLFRPHMGLRSKYHAVNFLSQIRLSHRGDGPKVAKRMIDVYFALFKVLITEAGSNKKMDKSSKAEKNTYGSSKENEIKNSPESPIELDSRLLSALLTGVNRAFPYVSSVEADDIIEVQTPTLFQLVHSKNFNVGIQALMLLDKISSKNQIVSDRFYRSLYSKLLLPAVMNSSKAEMFIGLLLRAMKSDVNLKRVAAFSKRLLQVALQQPPQYSCGCLFLLSEVLKARPPLWNMVLQSESVDEDLEHFEDIVEETDNEPSTTPKKEEIGVDLVGNSDKMDSESDSAEDEDDSPASSSEDDVSDEDELIMEDSSKEPQESQPQSDHNGNQPLINSSGSSLPGGYDPRHREPSYCNADHASWWELMVLASHAHPSVATMAGTLLSGANIVYNGNPLNDLSLTAFLDKFMEKKPKQTAWHGGSQIEPAKKLDMNMHLIGPEILSLAEVDVPPEDLVFHKFYVNKMNTSKPKKKKKKKAAEEEAAEDLFDVGDGDGGDDDDDDDDVVGDDESDNEEIDDLLDSANLSHGAENEYDYDDLDQVVNEDDEDLVDDVEVDALSDTEGEDFDTNADSDNDTVDVGDADDGTDEDVFDQQKRKRKSRGKAGASPFASLEEYEHILNEDGATKKKSERKKKSKSLKKRKSSK
ncbi:CCAAT-BINDING FACTOR-RELATED [Salix viminalis]|uniref:CCAAT-BINDING FACTOR-RELATED n=1 Tax=Salix viminalis TaxID=40686 RepID=A0A9Q0TNS7_SALVM|nr:CCAAT-BINDING FACTOR-RELATED [Salix viminalis]